MTEILDPGQSGALSSETTDRLRERLAQILARTAEDLIEMARIVRELESRGEDLSGLRLGMIDYLRRIAAGQLLPGLVVRLSGQPRRRRERVRADRERGGIVVGRAFARLDEVLRALAELSQADYDDEAEGGGPVPVQLTAAEHRQLKIRAAQANTTMGRLVRRALAAAGLLAIPVETEDHHG